MVVLLLVEEGIVSYLAPRGKQSTGVARPSSSHLSFAHRVRSLSFVIVSQVDDDTLTPYRPGRDCCVQGVKGLLLLLLGLGLLKLVHSEIATLFSLLIEALHLNADSRLIHELVLKVDALQPHSVLLAGLVSLGYAAMLL